MRQRKSKLAVGALSINSVGVETSPAITLVKIDAGVRSEVVGLEEFQREADRRIQAKADRFIKAFPHLKSWMLCENEHRYQLDC